MVNENKKIIKKYIENLGDSKGVYKVFNDMVVCCAYALANASDYSQDREDRFNSIIEEYGEEGKTIFAQILGTLYQEYAENSTKDILGEIYEEMNLSNVNKGQFFTPMHICQLMSDICMDKKSINNSIKNQGYTTVSDPACGSGRLLYSSYNTLLQEGVDSNNILLLGADVDIMCCCMTYIQLSLMGASAIVSHQNTLSMEQYDTFYTINYIVNKELQDKVLKSKEESEEIEV